MISYAKNQRIKYVVIKLFFVNALGRAAAPKANGGSVGLFANVLAAVVPHLLWAFRYYPLRWLTQLLPTF